MYSALAFYPSDRGAAFAYGSPREWLDVSNYVYEASGLVIDKLFSIDWRLATLEQNRRRQLGTCWRLRGFGTLCADERRVNENAEQAAALRPYLRRIAADIVTAIGSLGPTKVRQIHDLAGIRLNRGKAAPYWIPASDPGGAMAIGSCVAQLRTADERWDALASAGSAKAGCWQTSYPRIQAGAAEPRPGWSYANGRVTYGIEIFAPKARPILALPMHLNSPASGVNAVMRNARRLITGSDGTTAIGRKLVRKYRYVIATDISKCDQSISDQTLTAWREEILIPAVRAVVDLGILAPWEGQLLIENDAIIQRMPILHPPRDINWGAELVHHIGGLTSGEQYTSEKTTHIVEAFLQWRMDQAGVVGESVNAGDDALTGSNDLASLRRMAIVTKQLGITVTPGEAGLSWLQEYISHSTPMRGHRILLRMLARCINDEASRESVNIIENALSMRVREELLRNHPMVGQFRAILLEAPGNLGVAAKLAWGMPLETLHRAALFSVVGRMKPYDPDSPDDSPGWSVAASEYIEGTLRSLEFAAGVGTLTPALAALKRDLELLIVQHSMPYRAYWDACISMGNAEGVKQIRERSYCLQHAKRKPRKIIHETAPDVDFRATADQPHRTHT